MATLRCTLTSQSKYPWKQQQTIKAYDFSEHLVSRGTVGLTGHWDGPFDCTYSFNIGSQTKAHLMKSFCFKSIFLVKKVRKYFHMYWFVDSWLENVSKQI